MIIKSIFSIQMRGKNNPISKNKAFQIKNLEFQTYFIINRKQEKGNIKIISRRKLMIETFCAKKLIFQIISMFITRNLVKQQFNQLIMKGKYFFRIPSLNNKIIHSQILEEYKSIFFRKICLSNKFREIKNRLKDSI